jgi:hypothetical protein
MPGKFNIGRDLSFTVVLNGSVIKQFGLHTDTHFRPQWTEAKVRPTNNGGVYVVRPIFGGHEVELTYARVNGAGDNIAQFLEDTFKSGNPDVSVTCTETVRNDDGTQDQFNYINGICYPTDLGSFKGTDETNQVFKFFFPERQQVSSNTGTASTVAGGNINASAPVNAGYSSTSRS